MFGIGLSYATPSAYESQKERALLGLSADAHRTVRFKGKVRSQSTFVLRTVLRAFGEMLWSTEIWSRFDGMQTLDPVFTVHPDRLFLEGFSRDQSVYGRVTLDTDIFEIEGEPIYGTSNINFTAWLWAALAEMRSSRSTWLHLDSGGLELATVGSGGRFEKVVEISEAWLRGLLQLQHAMTMPGTSLRARPADLLAAIRFLRYSKARTSPRALRYELEPGQDARIVLEPWEQVFPLRGTGHDYDRERTIRTWGRQRLRLLEPVLPFAESVDIWLKGRNMPSFYQANFQGLTFLLGLNGGAGEGWTGGEGSYDLLLPDSPVVDEARRGPALEFLRERRQVTRSQVAEALSLPKSDTEALLVSLCREGQVLYELGTRVYRYRPLLDRPLDLARVFPPNPFWQKAQDFFEAGRVELSSCLPRETRKVKRLAGSESLREVIFRDWCLTGSVAEQTEVEVTLNDTDRIIFARCGCPHFQEHLMARGPCEHMLALRLAGLQRRPDLPTSVEAQEG